MKMIAGGATISSDVDIFVCNNILELPGMLIGCEAKNFEWSYLIEHCLVKHIQGLLGYNNQKNC